MAPVAEAARAGDAPRAAALWAATPLMATPLDPRAAHLARAMVLNNERLWRSTRSPELPMSPPAIGRLGEVAAPTLVVSGSQDQLDLAGRVASTVPEARLRVVFGAGHLVTLDAPEAFAGILEEFLGPGAASLPRAAAPD